MLCSEIMGAPSAGDGRYHGMVGEGGEILYDQKNAPKGMKNIVTAEPEVTSRFRRVVDHRMQTSGSVPTPKSY